MIFLNLMRMKISGRDDRASKIINHSVAEDRVTGTFYFPVILIDFPDQPGTFDKDAVTKHFFTGNPEVPRSVVDYYDEVSYGKFQMKCDVFGWFTSKYESPIMVPTTETSFTMHIPTNLYRKR